MKEFRKVDDFIKDKNNLNLLGFIVDKLGKIIYEHTDLSRRSKFKFQISNALDSGLFIIPISKTQQIYKVSNLEVYPMFDFVFNKNTNKRELVFYSNSDKGLLFAKSLIQDITTIIRFVTDILLLVSDIEETVDTLNVPIAKFTYKNHYAKFLSIEESNSDCIILTIIPKKKRSKKKRRNT